jgi:SAM-dependent methyltransferase
VKKPLSRWGFERGTPVDRLYIERFLDTHRAHVHGRVLEVLEDLYATRLGAEKVDVVDINPANGAVTIVGDLCDPATLPPAAFDTVVLTQTLQFLPDPRRALENLVAALRPGGSILLTVPTLSRVADGTDRWRWTPLGLRELTAGLGCTVEVAGLGNLATCRAFLMGVAVEDLPAGALAEDDPAFPLVVTAVMRTVGA